MASMSAAYTSTEIVILSDSDDDSSVSSLPVVPSSSRAGLQRVTETASTRSQINSGPGTQRASRLLAALDDPTVQEHATSSKNQECTIKSAKRKVRDDEARSGDRPQSATDKSASKERERRERLLKKQAIKAAKEAEKSFQKKLSEVNKLRISKNDTLREIEVYLSSDLESPASSIAGALPEIRSRFKENNSAIHFSSADDSPVPGVIRFRRHLRAKWDSIQKRFIPLDHPHWQWENTFVVIMTAQELVDKIALGDGTLRDWAADLRMIVGEQATSNPQMVLLVKGLEKYHSQTRSLMNKEYAAAARAGLGAADTSVLHSSRPSREDIDCEIVRLQVAEGCFMVYVEKTEDMEDWIYNLAADVALRPYKLLSKSHLNFCPADGLRKGSNPSDAFELMLQEVQGITPSAAAGIVSEHSTFRDLMMAYDRAGDESEGLLQDCQIRTLRNGVPNGRRLNRALSKRVSQVLRGEDGLALV